MLERLFWNGQSKIQDYKENKKKLVLFSLTNTIIPFGILYGFSYEQIIRKIPFSFQLALIGMFYLFNKNLILQMRLYKRRMAKYSEQIKLNELNKDLPTLI